MNSPIYLPAHLREQAEKSAQRLGLSSSELVEMALENFLQTYPEKPLPSPKNIQQGDLYWIAGEIPHPYVVIQDNLLNQSRVKTVVVCAITSNLKRLSNPGNVLLEKGVGGLPKESVVEVSKLSSVGKSELGNYIGTLSETHLQQIWAGIRFLQSSF